MDLRNEAAGRKSEADESRQVAKKMAQRHQITHYVIGGLIVVLGGVGALAGLASEDALAAGVLAASTTVAAGFQTLLRPQRMVQHHWERYAALRRLADDYSARVNDPAGPTRADLDELAARREQIDRPPP